MGQIGQRHSFGQAWCRRGRWKVRCRPVSSPRVRTPQPASPVRDPAWDSGSAALHAALPGPARPRVVWTDPMTGRFPAHPPKGRCLTVRTRPAVPTLRAGRTMSNVCFASENRVCCPSDAWIPFQAGPSSTFWMGRQGRFSPGCLVLLSSVSPDPPGTRLRWIATHCRRLGVGPPALTARPHLYPGVSDGESCGPCGFPTASQETGAGLSRALNQW